MRVNAALIAAAEAKKQEALSIQREAELRATQTAQATADAERTRIEATAKARRKPSASPLSPTRPLPAFARSTTQSPPAAKGISAIGRWNCCRRSRRPLPRALAQAKMVTICTGEEGEGAAGNVTENIAGVIRTVLAAQLVSKSGMLDHIGAPPAASSEA